MKRITRAASAVLLASTIILASCRGSEAKPSEENTNNTASSETEATSGAKIEDIHPAPVSAESVAAGKGIYALKCQACHKLTDEKLVGPGWKGITQRRKPGWIVAMITNPDDMLANDPEAKELLEEMLVKMPNQNLSRQEALQVLDFMRSNDGEK